MPPSTIDFSNPSVITIIGMLALAVGVLFRELSKRRQEEVASANQRHIESNERRLAEGEMWANRVRDLQERLREVEEDRDYFRRTTLQLAGVLQEVTPAVLRKKEMG